MPPQANSSGPAPVSTPVVSTPCFYLSDSEWKQGTIVQFAPLGNLPRFVVATADGAFEWVEMAHVKHGEQPPDMPRLTTDYTAGKKPHTLRQYKGKWLLASPDGRRRGEYDATDEGYRQAMAHFDKLEPELAKARAEAAKTVSATKSA